MQKDALIDRLRKQSGIDHDERFNEVQTLMQVVPLRRSSVLHSRTAPDTLIQTRRHMTPLPPPPSCRSPASFRTCHHAGVQEKAAMWSELSQAINEMRLDLQRKEVKLSHMVPYPLVTAPPTHAGTHAAPPKSSVRTLMGAPQAFPMRAEDEGPKHSKGGAE